MSKKQRVFNYNCATDGHVGSKVVNGKIYGGICGKSALRGRCGAHGNFKCVNKIDIRVVI